MGANTSAEALLWQWVSGAEGFANVVNLTALPDGRYTLLLKARDRAGNISPSTRQVNWTVDTVAPSNCTVSVINQNLSAANHSLSTAPRNRGVMTFAISEGLVNAGSPLAAVEYRWRGGGSAVTGPVTAVSRSSSGSSTAFFSLDGLGDGAYTMWVRGLDSAGNLSPHSCAIYSWTMDLIPPVSI